MYVNRNTLRARDGCIMVRSKIIPLYFCLPWERHTVQLGSSCLQKWKSLSQYLNLTAQTRRLSSGTCFLKHSRNLTYCIRLFLRCFLFHCILSLNFIQQYFLCCVEHVLLYVRGVCLFLKSGESLNVSISGESSSKIH